MRSAVRSFIIASFLFTTGCAQPLPSSFDPDLLGGDPGAGGGGGVSAWIGTQLIGQASTLTTSSGLARAADGSLYVTGNTSHAVFGETPTGTYDAYLVKYNQYGERQWAKLLGRAGSYVFSYALAIDTTGNVYIAGSAFGGIGSLAPKGEADAFVAKYASDGSLVWVRSLGGTNTGHIGTFRAVAIDGAGDVFLAGSAQGTIEGVAPVGNTDLFVAKYTAAGALSWSARHGTATKTVEAFGAKYTGAGFLVAGTTNGAFGGQSFVGSTTEGFFAAISAAGALGTTQFVGAPGRASAISAIDRDAAGNIFLTGKVDGSLDGETYGGADHAAFVTSYTSAGSLRFTRLFGGGSGADASGGALALDAAGNAHVAITAYGNVNGLTNPGSQSLALASVGNAGAVGYLAFTANSVGTADARGLVVNPAGGTYAAGFTIGSGSSFAGASLFGIGDTYLTKHDAAGVAQ